MTVTGEERNTQRKTCPGTVLTTFNSTTNALSSNLGLRGEKPVTERLSYCMAYVDVEVCVMLNVLRIRVGVLCMHSKHRQAQFYLETKTVRSD